MISFKGDVDGGIDCSKKIHMCFRDIRRDVFRIGVFLGLIICRAEPENVL